MLDKYITLAHTTPATKQRKKREEKEEKGGENRRGGKNKNMTHYASLDFTVNYGWGNVSYEYTLTTYYFLNLFRDYFYKILC